MKLLHPEQVSATSSVIHEVEKKLSRDNQIKGSCYRCGNQHSRDRQACPAVGKQCLNCGKSNHFAAVCRSKNNSGRTEHGTDQGQGRQSYYNKNMSRDKHLQRTTRATNEILVENDDSLYLEPVENGGHMIDVVCIDAYASDFNS
jgi:hypothetical protein